MKKFWRWFLSIIFTLILLIAVFKKVEIEQVVNYIKHGRPLPLLVALAVSFLTNCWLASLKWKSILLPLGLPLSLRETFLIKMGSLPLKSILPFRTGEATRVLYLKRVHHFSAVKTTASILLELLSNLTIFCLCVVIAGISLKTNPGGVIYVISLGLAGLILMLVAASRPFIKVKIAGLLEKIPSPRIRGGLQTLLTIHRFFTYSQIAGIFFYSLLIQSGKLLTFFLITQSFNITLPTVVYLAILPLSVLIASIPVTILGLGLREYSLTELIQQYTVVPAAPILGAALIFSLIEYIFPVLLGFFWMGSFTTRILGRNKKIP